MNNTQVSTDNTAQHFTVAQLAKRFGAHEITVRRWIREGRIKALHLGRLVRVPASEVARFENQALA